MPEDICVLLLSGGSSEALGSLFHLCTLSVGECCGMRLHCRILTPAFYGFIVSPSPVKGTPCSSIWSTVYVSPPLIKKEKIFKKKIQKKAVQCCSWSSVAKTQLSLLVCVFSHRRWDKAQPVKVSVFPGSLQLLGADVWSPLQRKGSRCRLGTWERGSEKPKMLQ